MSMVSEFKAFIARGNVLDLAVAVIIAAAFGKIVTALVDGIIMPIVGMAMGGVDFLLIAFVIFMIIKAYNRMIKKEEAAPAAPAEEILLLREIRDSLKRPGL